MSKPTVARETAPPEVRRRQLVHAGGGLALVLAVGVLAVVVMRKKPAEPAPAAPDVQDERLRDAVAEVDRLDPRWRFADLEADRARVPADENAAPLVIACHELIPQELNGLPTLRLREELRKGHLSNEPAALLASAKALLIKAREVAKFSRGRHTVNWNLKDPLLTPLPHIDKTGDIVDLLTLDAEVQAHKGDVDTALVSVRAALVATTTMGDEPMLASQATRLRWSDFCVQALGESLHRGQASEERLERVQAALKTEAAEPVMRTGLRAERAGLHSLLTALERGELTRPNPGLLGVRAEGVSLLLNSPQVASLRTIHAWILDYTTKFAAAADLPPAEQAPRLKELAAALPRAPQGALPLLVALSLGGDLSERCHKAQGLLRCAAVGTALERYRLANHRWPDKLGELAPKYLAAVPDDPFDGQPLRYARHKDGVIVYSVGPDGKDNGAARFERTDGADVSFRLWNVESRASAKK